MERLFDNINQLGIKVIQYSDTHAHLIKKYPSANESMDEYVLANSLDDRANGKSLTFLFVNNDESYLYGYYALFVTSIIYSDDESGEFVGIPSIELKLFAINIELSGKSVQLDYKYSDILLASIIGDIYKYSKEILGISAIVLRSTNNALNFYLRNKFKPFDEYLMLPHDSFSNDCINLIFAL